MAKKMTDADKVIHLNFEDNNVARDLFGTEDKHLKSLERMLGIDIHVRGNDLRIEGGHGDVETGERILNKLYGLLKRGYPILGSEIENALSLLSRDVNLDIESLLSDSIFLPAKRRAIVPRSTGQKLYIDAIRKNDIVFCIGPAGTGKTTTALIIAKKG